MKILGKKTREKILSVLVSNPRISTDELAITIGIAQKGIEWQIKKLKEDGLIKRIGPAKGGHWEVIEQEES